MNSSERKKIERFIWGLTSPIQRNVIAAKPETFDSDKRLAKKLYDHNNKNSRKPAEVEGKKEDDNKKGKNNKRKGRQGSESAKKQQTVTVNAATPQDRHMEEAMHLLQPNNDEPNVLIRQETTHEAAIWVEVGDKRKFEGYLRSNKNYMFSNSGGGSGNEKLGEKCKKKHSRKYRRKVTCLKCGKIGHYANEFNKRMCYGCKEESHISRDCQKKNKGARTNAPPKPDDP
ncbi:uncharacterized protein LOC111905823 [Lactuca sativa]|uniref:uncharacterized protein LOC111905823 n=1 Tax=Lactuca sativa TaxID=4236 RepID=UPI000CD9195F|nr:uncharacterized protein LOC111905823 [Lactuca sativa]